MYIRANHKPQSADDIEQLIAENMFGALVSHSGSGLFATHLPFLYEADRGMHGVLVAHLARANPHADLLRDGGESLVIFGGPHGYVSPSLFPNRARAPTWNYAAVHCYGRPKVLAPDATREVIGKLVHTVERTSVAPWSPDELSAAELGRLLDNVVAFEIELTRVEAKFKVSQGEQPQNLVAAIKQLENQGQVAIAALMRRFNQAVIAAP
jgi:transcriptional regulator